MGSFLSRTLLMASGYAYPAYECFKAVEKNEPEIEQLRFWCQYWILMAILTVWERIGDSFVSWLPLYSEVKLAFVVYLWHPKWKGTAYVYDSLLRPYVAKHETEIDRSLSEIKVKAGEVRNLYWQRAMSYAQTMILEFLQHFSSQKSSQLSLDQQQRLSEEQGEGNERMMLAQSCVKTASQSSVSRTETVAIQPISSLGNGTSSSSQEQTSYEEAVFKRRGIWRIFKTAAH